MGFGIDGVKGGEGNRVPVAGGFAEPLVGPVFPGVLVDLIAPPEDRPAPAGMFLRRGHKAKDSLLK